MNPNLIILYHWRRKHIPGYVIIRKDRNRYGGGVAIYIKENISCSARHDLIAPAQLEMICAEINLPYNKSFLVSTLYRPPNADINVLKITLNLLKNVITEISSWLFQGIWTVTILDWNPSEPHSERLTSIQLQQLISEPTRVTNRSASLIDLIFTNDWDKKHSKIKSYS